MGGSMHIHIDTNTCQGHGQCVHLVPEVFRMGANGVSELVLESPDESLRTRIDEAVRSCPVEAIAVHD
jgi:ferredoxin